MLSVKMQRDIGKYEPKIVGQLTVRSLICTVAAIASGLAIGAWFWLVLGVDINYSQYAIIVISLPIWAAGFWRPKGLQPEEFLPLWFTHNFGNSILLYSFSQNTSIHKQRNKEYARACKKLNGIEAYSPTPANAN